MLRQPGRVFSRAALLQETSGYDRDSAERAIDTHVSNLRRKIEPNPRRPRAPADRVRRRLQARRRMSRRRVPWRRSLLVRLLATSLLIAVCAIAATAWLAVQLTKHAVTQEQARTLSADTGIYDALVEYAATHDSWDRRPGQGQPAGRAHRHPHRAHDARPPGPSPVPAGRARRRRGVRRAHRAGRPALPGPGDRPQHRRAGSTPARSARTASPRTSAASCAGTAAAYVGCLRSEEVAAEIVGHSQRRPVVRRISAAPLPASGCEKLDRGSEPVESERKPLADLTRLVRECTGTTYALTPLFDVRYDRAPDAGVEQELDRCVSESRRTQLRPYVAPPALLFVTGRVAPAPSVDLSGLNQLKIVGTTGIVLVLAIIATVVVGRPPGPPATPAHRGRRPARRPAGRGAGPRRTTRSATWRRRSTTCPPGARALERSARRMVSDIAHELRTP
jgi:two-component system sensor histidine kinase BaeS